VAVGILLGGVVSWWAARFVGGLVYGLPARDPVALAGSAVVLMVVGALAGGCRRGAPRASIRPTS
jgi:hypothetical protein